MHSRANSNITLIERRALRWLLFFYCLFILYGTFIPFRFSDDAAFVQSQRMRFIAPFFVNGVRQFSIPDVVSNIALFIPFGFLWLGSGVGKNIFARLWAAFFAVGLLGALFGLVIELGQLFSPGRTASILDIICNGSGAALGGLFGHFFFQSLRSDTGALVLDIIRQRPSLLLLSLLLLASATDAYYPFEVTLDVSAVWGNFKHARWIPFVGAVHRYWLDLVIEKALPFAAMGYLAQANSPETLTAKRTATAWYLCVAFAFCVEAGKLFFAGRSPNAENFVLAAAGALLGVLVVPRLAVMSVCRRHAVGILTLLVIFVVGCAELSPFDWIESVDQFYPRMAAIEWLPFSTYYGADPRAALFDLAKKFFLVGPLGFLIAKRVNDHASRRWRALATLAGLLLGAVLETLQIALRSRTPSITDVFLFAVASWFGAFVFERYLELRNLGSSTSNQQHT